MTGLGPISNFNQADRLPCDGRRSAGLTRTSTQAIHSSTTAIQAMSIVNSAYKPQVPPFKHNTEQLSFDQSKWDNIRKQIKQIEFELDTQLSSYSQLGLAPASGLATPLSFAERQQQTNSLSDEINTNLSTLNQLTTQLAHMTDGTSRKTLSISSPSEQSSLPFNIPSICLQHLQRHNDMYRDYSREYQRIKASLISSQSKFNASRTMLYQDPLTR